MRRKSFRLPCRTISERSGRRSGHSPPPPPDRRIAQQYAAKPAKLTPPHGTLHRIIRHFAAPHHGSPTTTDGTPTYRSTDDTTLPQFPVTPQCTSPRRTARRRRHAARPTMHDLSSASRTDGISRRSSRTAAAFFPKQNRIRGTLSRKNGYLCRAKVSEVSSGLRESIGNAVQFGDSTCCCEFRSSRQGEDDSATHSH